MILAYFKVIDRNLWKVLRLRERYISHSIVETNSLYNSYEILEVKV